MIYQEKFFRNPLTKKQQEKIRGVTFALVGLGGTGGFIMENLLRMGAENLVVFDNDRFELSNFNRQSLAVDDFIDVSKVQAAVARAKAINNSVNMKTHGRFRADSDLGGAALILDGADNILTKLAMARAARKKRIPYIFCSASSTRGIVSVFTRYRFEKAFQLPKDEKLPGNYGTCPAIMCPAASLAGTLAASQAINYVIGKPCVRAPEAFFFDLFQKKIFWRAELG